MIIKDLRLETLNLQNRDLQSSRMQKFNSQRDDNPLRLFLTNRRHFIELGNVFFISKLNNISMKRWKDIDIFETQVSMTNQGKLLTKHNTRYVVFFKSLPWLGISQKYYLFILYRNIVRKNDSCDIVLKEYFLIVFY